MDKLWTAGALASLGLVFSPLAQARAASSCSDYAFPVYFRAGSAALASGARSAIAAAAHHFRPCRIQSITVVGLPAPMSGRDLTERRLHAVARELAVRGLRKPPPRIAAAIIAKRRSVMTDQAEVDITIQK